MTDYYDDDYSSNNKDYIWTFDNTYDVNDNVKNNVIFITKKNNFHSDIHLSSILNLPKELNEVCESLFEIDNTIDIRRVMDSINIKYSQKLYDYINGDNDDNPAHCQCYKKLGYDIDSDIDFIKSYEITYNREKKINKLHKLNEKFKLNKIRHKLISINNNIKCYNGVSHMKVAVSNVGYNLFVLFDINFIYNFNNKRKFYE
jgi:hypothetical protein